MTNSYCHKLIVLCVLTSCVNSEESLQVHPTHVEQAMVVYEDEPGYSTLSEISGDSLHCIKRTFWPGFSEQMDTLNWNSTINRWYSRKYTTQYEITDSTVNWWFELKIVHPSSNWQGQTPGLKLVPYQGQRLK